MTTRIEDYALIGDLQTVALVERGGSIDWLCFPRFDSGACFAALLGTEDNGRWLLAPRAEGTPTRRYLDDTLVLETTWENEAGSVRVLDFMPPRGKAPDVSSRPATSAHSCPPCVSSCPTATPSSRRAPARAGRGKS